jgi:hypothetical protein
VALHSEFRPQVHFVECLRQSVLGVFQRYRWEAAIASFARTALLAWMRHKPTGKPRSRGHQNCGGRRNSITHVLDERMNAVVRDLHPLTGD